jgi:hypothetical protein
MRSFSAVSTESWKALSAAAPTSPECSAIAARERKREDGREEGGGRKDVPDTRPQVAPPTKPLKECSTTHEEYGSTPTGCWPGWMTCGAIGEGGGKGRGEVGAWWGGEGRL